jgi:TrmH family RNA methyltransferase
MTTITSLHNERVKLVRGLQTRSKLRRQENRIVLEGVRLVGDAIESGVQPDFVLYTPEIAASQLLANLQNQGIPCLEVTSDVMAHVSDTQTPQGIIAVVPTPEIAVPRNLTLALILDGIADPGNLGTILRTAAAAGVDLVVLAPHCVDPFNPKVLRSGMGAHFRVPIVRQSWQGIASDYGGLHVYLADSGGETRYDKVDWSHPSALIVGGETRGIAPQAHDLAEATISIPMHNAVESLNAAVATGVILFEISRQRLASH